MKRQQRKLNFLITQTELYAHFMAKKMQRQSDGEVEDMEAKDILERLEENRSEGRLAEIDSYDCDAAKATAESNASKAVQLHDAKRSSYEVEAEGSADPGSEAVGERSQPDIFNGELKNYQLKGMNWLVSLYDQVGETEDVNFDGFFYLDCTPSRSYSSPSLFHSRASTAFSPTKWV